MEGHDGWIPLKEINKFSKMKKFNLGLAELHEMMGKSIVVDVDRQ